MERRDAQNLRRQSVVVVLLLTLLVANPLQGFSQGVITDDSTTGTNLNLGFGLPTNSVTVMNGVTINNSDDGSDAVFGNTHPGI